MTNAIVTENALQGTPRSEWDAEATRNGNGETLIEGFATDISVNHGQHIDFKINVNAEIGVDVPYHIEIYRLGYYGGDGARLVYSSGQLTGEAQPDPLYDPATGLVDAGNWSVSTGWDVPADAVSGVYLVKLVREDNGATNQIPFIVRDDDGPKSDIVLQTSDTTWHAYNGWGGNNGQVGGNFYGDPSGTIDHPDVADPGLGAQDRAYAVSYNRPFLTREGGGAAAGPHDYLFGADYAAIYWLEKNGYDVSYISGVDTDRLGEDYLIGHKAFISVGHDEYWSGQQRANVEAARDAGVNLLFWSGNEVYWKTRMEDSISADGTPYRTLVSYKETWANADPNAGPEDYANIDPANDWTGTWRDMRFVDAVDAQGNHIAGGSRVVSIAGTLSTCGCITGASPEQMLTGQSFVADGTGQFGGALDVPAALASLRFWRDTTVADTGQLDIAPGILGYEWDVSPEDQYRPAGLIKLSETVDVEWGAVLVDQGNNAPPGSATHALSLYRAPSGALVFGAGTVFWSWGLSNEHDSTPYGANIESLALQQFTMNMFADMGIQPGVADAVLASQGLVRAVGSTDTVAATAAINALPEVHVLDTVIITGTATDNDGNPLTDDGRVAVVEVSVDNGATWRLAEGTSSWSYAWRPMSEGNYTIKVRAIDDSLNVSSIVPAQATVTVGAPIVPDTFSVFDPSAPLVGATLFNDGQAVEIGMKFTVDSGGLITELKYHRAAADAGDTDVREGHLWGPNGELLATVTFTSAPGQAGWQVATLSTPVAIVAGVQYVVSYRTENNYLATQNFFTPGNEVAFDGVDDNAFSDVFGRISAPQSVDGQGNGVYVYGNTLVMPSETYRSENYWVDVTFDPTDGPNDAPTITSGSSFTIAEGQRAAGTVTAADANSNAIVYAIAGGADAAKFTINPTTGALAFVATPDFETPGDVDGDNVYEVVVSASDGIAAPVTQAVTITVTDVNEALNSAPTITSSNSFTLAENQTAVGAVTATDANNNAIVYAIAGGADAAKLAINPTSGALTFVAAPNFEVPGDADGDNVYAVIVSASDGIAAPVTQAVTVTVTDVAEAPNPISLFNGSAATNVVQFNDNTAVELGMKFTVDQDGQITELRYYRAAGDAGDTDVRAGHLWGPNGQLLATVTFTSAPGASGWQTATLSSPVTIEAGAQYVVSYRTQNNYVSTASFFAPSNEVAFDGVDNDAFTSASGHLSAPDSSVGGGNGVFVYGTSLVMPEETYGGANYWVDVGFNPTGQPNNAPTITSSNVFAAVENQTTVGTVTATDANNDSIVYAIAGGVDAAKLAINPTTGALTFVAAPNFEAPGDANGDNAYEVIVSASDGIALPVTQAVTVTVSDVAEIDPISLFDASTPTNAVLSGENTAVELGMKFTVDQDGQITELRYYRAAGDAGDTDVREGHLWGPNGELLATVTFTSAPGQSGWQTATLSAPVDIEAGAQYVVSYRTQDNYVATAGFFAPGNEVAFDGLDNDAFTSASGHLSAPDSSVTGGNGVFVYGSALVMPAETWGGGNYWVDVGFNPTGDPNGVPTITSGNAFAAAEKQTAVGTVTATDPDNDSMVYAIAGGADAARLVINPTTGALTFAAAPDFEAPADADGDNVYEVIVSASDGIAAPVTQAVAVTVTDVEEPDPISLFNASTPANAVLSGENTAVELGMKFTVDQDGQITELKYYRAAGDAGDTDVRDGHLWGPNGELLATVTFTSAPDQSGWQTATLSAPVDIEAGTQYVVSYRTQDNYVATANFFDPSNEVAFDGLDNNAFTDPSGHLSAPDSSVTGGNGVFVYGSTLAMPEDTFGGANYWLDVTFHPTDGLLL